MQVKIIARQGQSILIEWVNGDPMTLHRSFVLEENLIFHGDRVFCEYPERGLAYGLSWSEVAREIFESSNEQVAVNLEHELHRLSIWTFEDARNNPSIVTTALQTALSISARRLLSQAKDHLEKEHNGNE